MKKIPLLVTVIAFLFASVTAQARTVQAIDMITEVYYPRIGYLEQKTELFINRSPKDDTITHFWVKYSTSDGEATEQTGLNDSSIYIKEFPIARYHQVRKKAKKVDYWGRLIADDQTCDRPSSTIRRGRRSLVLEYRCGTGSEHPSADAASKELYELINALRNETYDNPDLSREL
ncbi:MAG: hypothetical protein OIF38_16590 [Cellvibrionaceae bacterium]|nr:hypothetical protein [Cellvibrionaceae bacterium]